MRKKEGAVFMRTAILATALLSLAAATALHAQDAIRPAAVTPAAQSFDLGKLQLTVLHDAQLTVPNDGKIFGIDAKPGEVAEVLRAAAAPTATVTLSINVLLVKAGRRIVLLDTGLGPMAHGVLMSSLQRAAVAPAAVTDILITHSHGDHIGGLLDANDQLAFPNARIRMSAAEWAWLKKQGPARQVAAFTPHVETFEPGATVVPGIRSRALPGHTPGHVGYEISSGQSHLLDIGDTAHSSIISLAKPQWTMGFDTDKDQAKATRTKTLAALAASHELIYAPHFPFPGVGHIVAAADGFKWQPAVPLP
jgi:glyoxylase-like metal-dependent hydrolase (beta-lactamase superfamily II)